MTAEIYNIRDFKRKEEKAKEPDTSPAEMIPPYHGQGIDGMKFTAQDKEPA